MIIESAHNETYRKLLGLTTSKGLKEEGLFLLSGEKLIREFLEKPHLDIVYELLLPDQKPLTNAKQIILASALFSAIDVLGTYSSILVLKQPSLPALTAGDMQAYRPQGIEVVAPVGDPGNLGALIRSCEAFGVPLVILAKEAANPFLPKSVKASAGSVLRVPMAKGPALAAFPHDCIALDTQGIPIDEFKWPQNGLLLLGEEGPGFSLRKFATRICIPTQGVESLNVVVAASIALSRIPKRES